MCFLFFMLFVLWMLVNMGSRRFVGWVLCMMLFCFVRWMVGGIIFMMDWMGFGMDHMRRMGNCVMFGMMVVGMVCCMRMMAGCFVICMMLCARMGVCSFVYVKNRLVVGRMVWMLRI